MITVKVDPNSPGLKLVDEMVQKMKRMGPLMKKIASLMLSIVRRNFQAGGRPPWPPRKSTQNHRLLWKTGRLIGSLHQEADDYHAEVSTNVVYAAVHQFGHTFPLREIRPKRKRALFWPGAEHPVKKVNWPGATVPARPFMVIPDEEMPTLEQAAQEYLEK